jgi:hypothetical protein
MHDIWFITITTVDPQDRFVRVIEVTRCPVEYPPPGDFGSESREPAPRTGRSIWTSEAIPPRSCGISAANDEWP